MSEYLESFEKAWRWTNSHSDKRFNYPMCIDSRAVIDGKRVLAALVTDFSTGMGEPKSWPGHCFHLAREISLVLLQEKVKHVVTVGEVLLPTGPYAGMTKPSLKRDLASGYRMERTKDGGYRGMNMDAHCWITLETGQVIDATIVAAYNSRCGIDPPNFENAIHFTGVTEDRPFQYVPMMTGFYYHLHVATCPPTPEYQEEMFHRYLQWFHYYHRVIPCLRGITIR